MKYEAILALHNETNPNTGLTIYGSVEKLTSLEGVKSNNESPKFTWDEVLNKEKELQAIEPMRLLRQERDRRIVETDWWAGQDLTMTQKQKNYRQALRDLPSTAEPQLDEEGNLTNVTWPTKPE